MKKVSILLVFSFLLAGLANANVLVNQQKPAQKKEEKKTDKKEVKKVPARKKQEKKK